MLSRLVSFIIFCEKEGLQKETNVNVQVTGKISKEMREKEITEISRCVWPASEQSEQHREERNPWPAHSAAVYTRVT